MVYSAVAAGVGPAAGVAKQALNPGLNSWSQFDLPLNYTAPLSGDDGRDLMASFIQLVLGIDYNVVKYFQSLHLLAGGGDA